MPRKLCARSLTSAKKQIVSILSLHRLLLIIGLCGWLPSWPAQAGGTWSALTHPPPAGLNNSLLLGDGTVICGDGGSGWYRLTPDIHGSYVNGTWSVLAATHYTRLFYSSQVMTNGSVYVAGGEIGRAHV